MEYFIGDEILLSGKKGVPMARKPSVNLKVVPPAPRPGAAEPPGKLGDVGLSLWRDIVSAYEFSDRASYETLFQACAAADRAAKAARDHRPGRRGYWGADWAEGSPCAEARDC
jgi:hypothetical protein